DRVRFHVRDYREETGTYDRIVSVGMFEHVGIIHFRDFFDTIKGLLSEDGVALIHAIGRGEGPGVTNPWIRKYIFPGGYSPALSEVLPVVEKSGLWATDIEILRLHYAETLRAWRRRFDANRAEVAKLYDERCCRSALAWCSPRIGRRFGSSAEDFVRFDMNPPSHRGRP